MYFVQNLNFMCYTIYCNLPGEFVGTDHGGGSGGGCSGGGSA